MNWSVVFLPTACCLFLIVMMEGEGALVFGKQNNLDCRGTWERDGDFLKSNLLFFNPQFPSATSGHLLCVSSCSAVAKNFGKGQEFVFN